MTQSFEESGAVTEHSKYQVKAQSVKNWALLGHFGHFPTRILPNLRMSSLQNVSFSASLASVIA